MNNRIIQNLNNLPALNSTLVEVQKIKDLPEIGSKDIVKIIEKDPMETMNILKLANNPVYQVSNEIKNLHQAIAMFGITKTFAMLLDNNVRKLLTVDMKPYNVSPDDFAKISVLQSALAKKWCELQGKKQNDTIFLASLVQEVGKVIIADMILEDKEESNFSFDISTTNNINEIEQAYLGISTIEVTVQILDIWGIDKDIKDVILASNNPKKAPDDIKEIACALNVIRTAVPLNKPLSEQSVAFALKKSELYNLNTEKLKEAILFVQNFL